MSGRPVMPREEARQRRLYAIAGVGLIVCVCYLLVIGLSIALGVVASRGEPAPPPPPTGACCGVGGCTQRTDAQCNRPADQFYGNNTICDPIATCLTPPPQCLCGNDNVIGNLFVTSVQPSRTPTACVDIVLAFECTDTRTDTRCTERFLKFDFALLDDENEPVDKGAFVPIGGVFTEGGIFPFCSEVPTILPNFKCTTKATLNSSDTLGVTIVLVDSAPVDNNRVVTIRAVKNGAGGEVPPEEDCERGFLGFFSTSIKLDLAPFECAPKQ